MLTPLNLERIQAALNGPSGWIEVGAILASLAVAWIVDRRVRLAVTGTQDSRVAKIGVGSVNRLIFPITALVLLLLARSIVQRWYPPVFFPVAVPLLLALAMIRLFIYGFHNLFGAKRWIIASERAVSFTIWAAVILYYIGVLPEFAAALDETRLPIGKTEVSLLDIGRDGLVILVTIIVALWVSGLVEQQLLKTTSGDRNVRVVLAKFFRALLILVGVLVALSVVGIDLTVLSVFGGALGVGIGLGLQKLASNYIAGFTILLDRSIRMGDMITVDNRFGIVTAVTSRYVVVRSLDGVEALVPNETLVTTTVLNHSYTTKEVRVAVPIQVSYDSDLDLAIRLMEEVALAQPRVLRQPIAPAVFVVRFAESGIELEVAVWINDPENGQLNLKSALNAGIWAKFKDNGIKIPFPQREIRLLGDGVPDRRPTAEARPPERGA